MRSEFEKWLGDVWLSDAEWDESKNTYSDSRIHCMWSAWQHQQTKVDELQKRLDGLTQVVEELLEEMKYPTATFEEVICSGVRELEQAIKGGSDE